jgi:hypothetical protein
MKRFLQLAPVLICLAACQSNSSPAVNAQPVTTKPTKATLSVSEHAELSMLTVNGRPYGELTTKQLKSLLGRPDSIAKGAAECGNQLDPPAGSESQANDFWYYEKTSYEVSGTQAILNSFDVTSGKFQGKLGKLVLNKYTSLEDVRRFFPVSAKEAETPATGRPGEGMSLPIYYKGVPTDVYLILMFKKGRLQSVDFWSQC